MASDVELTAELTPVNASFSATLMLDMGLQELTAGNSISLLRRVLEERQEWTRRRAPLPRL
jgi:hypothetical protein